jgi:hypothetical protein
LAASAFRRLPRSGDKCCSFLIAMIHSMTLINYAAPGALSPLGITSTRLLHSRWNIECRRSHRRRWFRSFLIVVSVRACGHSFDDAADFRPLPRVW